MAGEDRDDIASQLSYRPILLGLRKIWLSNLYWKVQPPNGKDSGDDGSILNIYRIKSIMLVRGDFQCLEDSFQFTKTYPAWGFLLYFTYRNLYFTTAFTAPTTAWYTQTAALKYPDLGLAQKLSRPLNWVSSVIQTHVLGREKNNNDPYSTSVSRMKMTKVPIRTDLYTRKVHNLKPVISCIYVNFLCLRMCTVILTLWRLNKVHFKGLWTQSVLNKYLFFFSSVIQFVPVTWRADHKRPGDTSRKATQNYLLKW